MKLPPLSLLFQAAPLLQYEPTALDPPSLAIQHSTFTPLLPPAIPLAVRSPYVNIWLPGGRDGGYLAGKWAKHWPVSYPGSKKDYVVGWAGLIQVDEVTYEFMGDPIAMDIGTRLVANQTAFEYTATKSKFSFEAGPIAFNVTFLSPITPKDYVRMSLPLSYLVVEVDPKLLKKHKVAVYTDLTGELSSGDSNVEIRWSFSISDAVAFYRVSPADPLIFQERGEQAEWGSAVYATPMQNGVSTSSGRSVDVRREFVENGRLEGTQDVDYRSIHDHHPVFAFAKTLSSRENQAVFSIGHMREPYVNYVTRLGQIPLKGYWSTQFETISSAVIFHVQDFYESFTNATLFDSELRKEALRVSGEDYAAIVELSTRQAMATFELTVGEEESEVFGFLKEISSNGDMSTVDVIFPLYPILAYLNPDLIKLLLEPIMRYSVSGLYPNTWTVHDLGTYPNATGYNDGNDEPMPVEEAGNMLWMILAYWQLTKDTAWVQQHYPLLVQWTSYLIKDGLIPAEQLSTDDFAGTLSNQTNLAVKAIVGIGAMSQLAKATNHYTDFIHYDATARAYVQVWYDLALTAHPVEFPHAKLTYQDEGSHGLLYNLFGDRILNLGLFDRQLYGWQGAFYDTRAERFGVPLDHRHRWTKTDWECFAAASATTRKTRDMFFGLIVDYLKVGRVNAAFPDLYETNTADFPGRGQDWPIEFIARPVVGGHFALLALDRANQANGVRRDPFRG